MPYKLQLARLEKQLKKENDPYRRTELEDRIVILLGIIDIINRLENLVPKIVNGFAE